MATLARAEDEVCVCDFTEALPLEQPTVSHHLKILREAGLVTCERRGTWVYYRLAAGARRPHRLPPFVPFFLKRRSHEDASQSRDA